MLGQQSLSILQGGSSGKNPAEQQEQIDAIQDEEIARAETLSGTQNSLGASSDNGKYANGASTGSYGNTGASSTTTNSNGEIDLGTITVTYTNLPKGYEWIEDLPDYGYTAFTFTPVGGIYDTLVQYDNGEIGMFGAVGLLGLSVVPGGKALEKLNKYYASLEQMGSLGKRMSGVGTKSPFRNAQYFADSHGGNASDWVKMTSEPYTSSGGVMFETHWVENILTGERVNYKTKFPKGL